MSTKDDLECCICLENFSDNNNLLVEIPCTCKLWIHQDCFVKTNLNKCLICKKKYVIENFNTSMIKYLTNKNIIGEILSDYALEFDEQSVEEINTINESHLDILFDDTQIYVDEEEVPCKNFLLSLLAKIFFVYLLGLTFSLIYCGINQYTYPQLIWYLHILANLITGSVIFIILYFCCNQILYSIRNS